MNKTVIATIERHSYIPGYGTFGELTICGTNIKLATVERAWENNQPNISCIPEGIYICKKRMSPKFGFTFEVTHVPDRTHILFHIGNGPDNFQGCIGLGMRLGYMSGLLAVLNSKEAIEQFKDAISPQEEFALQIRQVEGARICAA